jgi:hypothetical protein
MSFRDCGMLQYLHPPSLQEALNHGLVTDFA